MSSTATFTSPSSVRVRQSFAIRWLTMGSIVLADLLGISVAGAVAVMTRYFFHGRYLPSDYVNFAPSILIFFIVFALSGLYPGVATSPIEEFRLILRSSSISFLVLIGTTFFLREGILSSRIVFVLAWLLTIISVPISRRLMRGLCSQQAWWGIPTVIIGEQEAGQMMLDLLEGHHRVGLRPVAILVDRGSGGCSVTRPESNVFCGDFTDAERLSREYRDCYAVIAMPNSGSGRIRTVFNQYGGYYRRVLIIPDLFGMKSLSVSAKDICGVLALELDQKLTLFVPRFVKRCFDIVASACVAFLVCPLLLLLCLAVRLSSPGPIFYGQNRIGKDRKMFKVWKFRTMVVDADTVLNARLNADPALRAEWEQEHKLKRDPRVTWIGRFLRKSSLDELPQVWNVLCGDMSLVGPRPITNAEIDRYGDIFDQYLRVTPGVTGLWQISGRNNTTYELRTRIDDYYVRNWSLYLDIYILIRTLKTIVCGEGAY